MEPKVESFQLLKTAEPDSLEWGSAAKGVKCKIYGHLKDNPEDMETKIKEAKRLALIALEE